MNKTWFWVFLIGLTVGIALARQQAETDEVVVVPA